MMFQQMDLFPENNKISDAEFQVIWNSEKSLVEVQRELELMNTRREETKAFYTNPELVSDIVNDLPDFSEEESLTILEPSVGTGSFIWALANKYREKRIHFLLIDINSNSLALVKELLKRFPISNADFRFIESDFFDVELIDEDVDLVVGNPPFGGTKKKPGYISSNLATQFLEKLLETKSFISLVLPKSVISAPSFSEFRDYLYNYSVKSIVDFGENGFKGVKIETINMMIDNVSDNETSEEILVKSFITGDERKVSKQYVMSDRYPYWLLYRNNFFDRVAEKMNFGQFDSFRDRQITKKMSVPKSDNSIRVLKSRNFPDGSHDIVDIDGYDMYVSRDVLNELQISKYVNQDVYMMPNLTYKPRSMKLPKNMLVDGSLALLIPKKKKPTQSQLRYFSSTEFRKFYKIARNYGTRSLNIDNLSSYFFGYLKE
ncbi:Eco57I restriction-modification methylase domain-containing protein [Weissella confusa]|jgi:Methylase of polypeptide chain release factors|uniref:Eco57I restriction-modification methylase domain-containing protein n=1 Tax=Weissella confusa TaxID=1583 RepID=UPI001080D8AA|nr:methyltransferase [Weissella confusa]MED4273157.1 methyltransferase [Weissella confusa]QYU58315.1 methyltransferase [Weissella confusa]TGE67259.1 hypothetical protein C6P15_08860 [Weissella confusa]